MHELQKRVRTQKAKFYKDLILKSDDFNTDLAKLIREYTHDLQDMALLDLIIAVLDQQRVQLYEHKANWLMAWKFREELAKHKEPEVI